MLKIHLATGPIQTGKTTRILGWCTGRTDVDGLLAPIVDGHRHLVRISTGEAQDLQELGRADDPVEVGPYTFSSQVFAWGREQLSSALETRVRANRPGWLVIDEYGKLELRGEGLEPAVNDVIERLGRANDATVSAGGAGHRTVEMNLLLVIREGLIEPSLQKLGIAPADVEMFDPT